MAMEKMRRESRSKKKRTMKPVPNLSTSQPKQATTKHYPNGTTHRYLAHQSNWIIRYLLDGSLVPIPPPPRPIPFKVPPWYNAVCTWVPSAEERLWRGSTMPQVQWRGGAVWLTSPIISHPEMVDKTNPPLSTLSLVGSNPICSSPSVHFYFTYLLKPSLYLSLRVQCKLLNPDPNRPKRRFPGTVMHAALSRTSSPEEPGCPTKFTDLPQSGVVPDARQISWLP
ncbi:hypothetical protein QBC44DRAFT_41624 [Cladorrhinum sp. PSN332]|nr:hypothetical protein QBC44DRAFT_41624 [Cladorrhinum sp. PSN332]